MYFMRTEQNPHGANTAALDINCYVWVAVGLFIVAVRRNCQVIVECDYNSYIVNMPPLYDFLTRVLEVGPQVVFKGSLTGDRLGKTGIYSVSNL